jgi:protein-disulfide isomerase
MAAQRKLTGFYAGLAAIVVVGAGALWMARRSGEGTGPQMLDSAVAPITDGFEGYVQGSDSAPVTIVEYADFECPACAQFAVLTGPDIKQRLVATGRVRWIFRDFPLTDIHRNAMTAHLAAACADEQGRFWEMHDQLFFNHRRWAYESRPERPMRELAGAIGLEQSRFNECLSSARYRDRILAIKQRGAESGISSTPTFDINNQRVNRVITFDSLRALVDRLAPPTP